MWSRKVPRLAVATCVSGASAHVAAQQYLQSQGLCPDCTVLDAAVCRLKGLLEGKHFRDGLGAKISDSIKAIESMKCTAPAPISVEWRSDWRQRHSQLSGQTYWVRRGAFKSPIATLLLPESQYASVWEVRKNKPTGEESEAGSAEDVQLPEATIWMGVPLLDRCIDLFVRHLNNVAPDSMRTAEQGTAILILPDFGGEFSKRTLPLAELVVAELPDVPVFLLEMPLRGTRKPPGYSGALLPTVNDMMHMGCAIIEESRGMLAWLKQQGYHRLTLSGISMGGHMAALTACCSPDVSRLCLLLPSHSAEANWTDGGVMGMNRGIPLETLRPYLWSATSLEAYPPCRAERAVLVAARYDGYVPFWSSERLRALLQQQQIPVQLRVISGGHVSGFLAHQLDFARAIVDATATTG